MLIFFIIIRELFMIIFWCWRIFNNDVTRDLFVVIKLVILSNLTVEILKNIMAYQNFRWSELLLLSEVTRDDSRHRMNMLF